MTNKPVNRLNDYPVEIALYEREGEHGTWINADVSKTYKQGEEYKKSRNFSRSDLLKLNALVPQAITRMQELEQAHREAPAPSTAKDMNAIKAEAQAHLEGHTQGQEHDQSEAP